MANKVQKTLVILKPDAIHRGIVGEILDRFEQKGIKIIGTKMIKMTDLLLDRHYAQHKGKHFLPNLKKFMKSLPVILVVLEGLDVVRVIRSMCGPTDGKNALPGTIRGDYSMSTSATIIHASEDLKTASREISIFFKKSEIFNYRRPDIHFFYAEDELK